MTSSSGPNGGIWTFYMFFCGIKSLVLWPWSCIQCVHTSSAIITVVHTRSLSTTVIVDGWTLCTEYNWCSDSWNNLMQFYLTYVKFIYTYRHCPLLALFNHVTYHLCHVYIYQFLLFVWNYYRHMLFHQLVVKYKSKKYYARRFLSIASGCRKLASFDIQALLSLVE